MINREWVDVEVVTFESGIDDYGIQRTQGSTSKSVKMVLKQYSVSNITNPKYVDVEMIGLSQDRTINESNQIRFNNINYNILYTIPSGKYLQVLMKKA